MGCRLAKFPIHTNCSLLGAESRDRRLLLRIHDKNRGKYEVLCDHIVAGTGFEVDVDRLHFLDASLRQAIARIDRSPRLDRYFSRRKADFTSSAQCQR
jgi:hypothetical protein